MRSKTLVVIAMLLLAPSAAVAQKPTEAQVHKEAKITKEQATRTALARVPNGTVKEAELEREKGKLVWSFDLATPGTKDITEIQVDAKTGEVVSQEKESAASEGAEKKAETKKSPTKH